LKNHSVISVALLLGAAGVVCAQTPPTKIATIHIQNAIVGTKDGQKALQDLQARFNPKSQALEKRKADLEALRTQMRSGSATMNQEAKDKLARDIDSTQKALQRDGEDFNTEVQQEENRVMGTLGQQIMAIVGKYALQNNLAIVMDVSNPQTQPLWAESAIDITSEIIKLYDQAHSAGSSAPATPPAAPATKKQ